MLEEQRNVWNLKDLLNGNYADKDLCYSMSNRLDKTGIYYRVFSRVKSFESTFQKLQEKREKYENRGKGMQDIIGVRVVLYFYDDIPICKQILSKAFKLIEEDSEEDIPKAENFEPVRKNYVFCLPQEIIDRFPDELWRDYNIEKTFELQLRTIFSEGWYEVEHDIRYKHQEEWRGDDYYKYHRGLSSINATLEICDHEIVRNLEDLAFDCYKKRQIRQMLRYKLRIHLLDETISEEIIKIISDSQDILDALYRLNRETVLCILAEPEMISFPRTMENIIKLCNKLYIHDKQIDELTPNKLSNKIYKGMQRVI